MDKEKVKKNKHNRAKLNITKRRLTAEKREDFLKLISYLKITQQTFLKEYIDEKLEEYKDTFNSDVDKE